MNTGSFFRLGLLILCVISMTFVIPCGAQSSEYLNLKNPRALAASGEHTCVLDNDGVKCWGFKKNWQISF